MKNSIRLTIIFLVSTLLVACGGGGSSSEATVTPATPIAVVTAPAAPTPNPSFGDLIINNGRGVTNNQDTERVK